MAPSYKGFPPRAFIVGAQKSGTTSLAALLGNNPQVCLAKPKEPNYYSVNYDKGRSWYEGKFEYPEKVLLDASTTYSMCPLTQESLLYKKGRKKLQGVAKKISKDSPDARIIYIIRDPVERVISNYWHNVKYGYETLPILEAVKRDQLYVEMSQYYNQIQLYLECFDKSQVLVIKFEDFVSNQLNALNQCEKHLGLELTAEVSRAKKLNRGRQYGPLGRMLIKSKVVNKFQSFIPAPVVKISRGILTRKIPATDKSVDREIRTMFEEDQMSLKSLYGQAYLE